MHRLGVDSLIVIGGEGTLAAAQILTDEGLRIVGVPKTIDNDLNATDYTFGFDSRADRGRSSRPVAHHRDSHHRRMIAEVMGRNTGWIALQTGIAAGAHAILIPEHTVTLEHVATWVTSAHSRGRAPLVVVAEAFVPAGRPAPVPARGMDTFGRPRYGGISLILERQIEELTGTEARATVLGAYPAWRRVSGLRSRAGHTAGNGRR